MLWRPVYPFVLYGIPALSPRPRKILDTQYEHLYTICANFTTLPAFIWFMMLQNVVILKVSHQVLINSENKEKRRSSIEPWVEDFYSGDTCQSGKTVMSCRERVSNKFEAKWRLQWKLTKRIIWGKVRYFIVKVASSAVYLNQYSGSGSVPLPEYYSIS